MQYPLMFHLGQKLENPTLGNVAEAIDAELSRPKLGSKEALVDYFKKHNAKTMCWLMAGHDAEPTWSRPSRLEHSCSHIGRPYLYGLAAAGDMGVKRIVEILRNELERRWGCSVDLPSRASIDPYFGANTCWVLANELEMFRPFVPVAQLGSVRLHGKWSTYNYVRSRYS